MSSPPPLDLNFINTFLHQVWKDDLKVTPKQFQPIPSFDNHMDIVKEEQQIVKEDEASSRRTVLVNERILKLQMKNPTDFGGPIDWKFELSAFRVLPYPSYYTKPFHQKDLNIVHYHNTSMLLYLLTNEKSDPIAYELQKNQDLYLQHF